MTGGSTCVLSMDCCQVIHSDRGDYIFQIISLEEDGRLVYSTVAEVDSWCFIERHRGYDAGAMAFVNRASGALGAWFGSPPYSSAYKERVRAGRGNPHSIWKRIRKHHDLSDRFDIKPTN